jgi:hypothetical protein
MRQIALPLAAAAFVALAFTPRARADSFPGQYDGTLFVHFVFIAGDVSMKGDFELVNASVDAVDPPVVLFAPQGSATLFEARVADGTSFKQRKFRSDAGDAGWADRLYDVGTLLILGDGGGEGAKRKKPNVGIQPGDITSATPKGSVKSKKASLVLDVKLNYTVEGAVVSGEHAGKTFRGKLKLRFKGDGRVF